MNDRERSATNPTVGSGGVDLDNFVNEQGPEVGTLQPAASLISPCFLDFEASGLDPFCFPIEVAWSVPSGAIRSALIAPTAHWLDTGLWDPGAEALHGITVEQLAAGWAVPDVAAALNHDLVGNMVYVDALAFDRAWLNQLFDAAGTHPAFRLDSVVRLIEQTLGGPTLGREWYERLFEDSNAGRSCRRRHRAADDVKRLKTVYERVMGGAV